MRVRPIIFSRDMVLAILANRKTQTRRPLKPHLKVGCSRMGSRMILNAHDGCGVSPCPYGQAGDRLWVKETWGFRTTLPVSMHGQCSSRHLAYKADDPAGDVWGWKSARFMPQWASRLVLEVTGTRIERLQDISEMDAIAEGVMPCGHDGYHTDQHTCSFRTLWDAINAKRVLGWDANPWVWVVRFRRVD